MSRNLCRAALCVAVAAWCTAANAQVAGLGHAAAIFPDHSILITGGESASGLVSGEALLYLPDQLTIEGTGAMNVARSYHGATTLLDGTRVLISGGWTDAGVTGAIELFDLTTGEFTASGASLAVPRYAHQTALMEDGRVLILGGYDESGAPVETDEVFDPSTGACSALAPDATAPTAPWVSTDLADYFPGQPVLVSFGGFAGRENVTLMFDQDPLLRAPELVTVIADDAGGITEVNAYLVGPEDFGTQFVLRAVGESGRSAETWFTDAKPAPTRGLKVLSVVAPASVRAGEDVTVTVTVYNDDNAAMTVTSAAVSPPNWALVAVRTLPLPLLRNGTPDTRTATLTLTVRAAEPAVAPVTVALSAAECNPADAVCSASASSAAVTVLPSHYEVTVVQPGQGEIRCGGATCASGPRPVDSTLVLTAAPAGGYAFGAWTGACQGQGNPCTIAITSDLSVSARFDPIVTITQPAEGGAIECGGAACASGPRVAGTILELLASPAATHVFGAWTGACAGQTSPTCSLPVNAPAALSASFVPLRRVSITQPANGQIRCGGAGACPTSDRPEGSALTLTAHAAEGYAFAAWTGDCAGQPTATCSLTVSGDRTISAAFLITQRSLSVLPSTGNGRVECAPGVACPDSIALDWNTPVSLRAVPGTGSRFSSWSQGPCAGSADPACAFNLSVSTSVRAVFAVTQETLRVQEPTGGAILCDGAACAPERAYDYGTVVKLEAVADPEFEFAGWTGDCESEPSATCWVTMARLTTVSARFADATETLTIEPPVHGGVHCGAAACPATSEIPLGDRITLTASAEEGWAFSSWTGACAAEQTATCSLVMDGPKTVSANFTPSRHDLTIAATAFGAIRCGGETACAATSTHDWGTEIVLTAVAEGGYALGAWTGACAGETTTTCTVTVDRALSVGALFAPVEEPFALTVVGSGEVTCNGAPCEGGYDHASTVTLLASGLPGWTFEGWSGACGGTAPSCQVTMDAEKAITATFRREPQSLAVSVEGKGVGEITCDGEPCAAQYAYGTGVTLEAIPAPGSIFTGWSGACQGDGECTVIVTGNTAVVASFALETHALTLTPGSFGRLLCGADPCASRFEHGTRLLVTAAPDVGFGLEAWGDACLGSAGPTCEVVVDRDLTVSASFVAQGQVLSIAPSTGGGTVLCDGRLCPSTQTFPAGGEAVVTASPLVGYVFSAWSGACAGQQATCRLTMDADRTTAAIFAVDPAFATRKLTVAPVGGGAVSIALVGAGTLSRTCRAGDAASCTVNVPATTPAPVLELTATADGGSILAYWRSPCSGAAPTCRVTMSGSPTVQVVFQPATYGLSVTQSQFRGPSSGTITGDLNAARIVDCRAGSSAGCAADVANVPSLPNKVVLTATPAADSKFWMWGGACSGTAATCTVTMSSVRNVVANFTPAYFTLGVQTWGQGQGRVTAPAGFDGKPAIDCSSGSTTGCTMSVPNVYPSTTSVTLTAVAGAGSRFMGWSGPCTGSSPTCTVAVGQAVWATATFEPSTYPLTVSIGGTASGIVTSSYDGATCTLGTCTTTVPNTTPATQVTLTAVPGAGAKVSGWVGCASSTATTCTVSMAGSRLVKTGFVLDPLASN